MPGPHRFVEQRKPRVSPDSPHLRAVTARLRSGSSCSAVADRGDADGAPSPAAVAAHRAARYEPRSFGERRTRLIAALSAGRSLRPHVTASATRCTRRGYTDPAAHRPATCTTSFGAAAARSGTSAAAGCEVAVPAPASVRPATTSSTRAAAASASARRRDTGREGMLRACRETCHGGLTPPCQMRVSFG